MRMYSNIFRVLCIIILAFTFAWSTSCGSVSLTSIVLTPEAASIAAGATQQFTATGVHADGSTVDITATVTWASSDAAIAAFETPDTNGLATAVAAGTVTISAADADSGLSGSTDMTVAALSGTITSLYTNNTNWNDYLANDGTDVFTASDAACDAATDGPWYNACLNGGFFRSVEVTGRSVCDGLTATDSLGAFNWACDSNTNDVRMVSVGFADGMGMSDLIDFDTAAWKQLNVTVFRSGNAYLATDMATWWGNTIVVNNTGAAMNTESEIHIVTVSNPGSNYVLGADKVTLLIKPGVTMNGPGTNADVIAANSQNFLWIEGSIDAPADDEMIILNGVKFSQIRNIRLSNNTGYTVDLPNSSSNMVFGATLANNDDDGIEMASSTNNILANIMVTNNTDDGIFLGSAAADNIFINTTLASNSGNSFYSDGSANNAVVNITISNTSSTGFFMLNSADYNTAANMILVNGKGTGLSMNNAANNNTFANLVTAHNDSVGINLGTVSYNKFTGVLKVGFNTTGKCLVTGPTSPGLINNTCTDTGTDGSNTYTDQLSDATLRINTDLTNSFLAKVSDSVNPDGATGSKAYDVISDWVDFENTFRNWGRDGGDFPDMSGNQQGSCASGDTCQIWDWSLASADAVLRNVLALPTGNDTLTHTWTAGSTVLLRNAVEIFDDGIGNENGLCESNETCLYTPNIGSYQGHGNLISAGAFTDGTITGVTLMQYETNGR